MDPIHKKVLANKTGLIMERISNPVVLSGHLAVLFSTSDKEEIDAKTKQYGATIGTQTLLNLLEKRGPKAFQYFIDVLWNPQLKLEDLAEDLEQEDRRLRGKPEIPMRRAQSLPPSNEIPVAQDYADIAYLPPPPYSAPVVNNNGLYQFNEGQQLLVNKQSSAAENVNNQAHQEQTPRVLTGDSLVKEIPFSLRMKIEKMLNVHNANTHDWRGVASAMDLSTDDVNQLEQESGDKGKMGGLFDKMIHTKKTINDLIALLRHDDVQRLDVIDDIIKDCNLRDERGMKSESSEDLKPVEVLSSVEETCGPATESKAVPLLRNESEEPQETCNPTTEPKSLPFPRQESEEPQDTDKKPDARIPSQVESDDSSPKGKGQFELDNKPDAREPTQVEDNEDLDYNKPASSQLPFPVEDSSHVICNDDDDDDVFGSTEDSELKKHALLISCCGTSTKEKLHDKELRSLEGVLEESGWQVKRQIKCKVSNLIQTVHSFLVDSRESERIIYFVYLVGPTVHINGENYLLPADLKSPSSRADLMHSALNINWLVSQLSKSYMQVVVVDGALENALADVQLNGVLRGLAPICPPTNAIIAFPCHPGTLRTEEERLDYIKSVVKNLQQESLMLDALFDKVREDFLKNQPSACGLPVEFSLTSSLLPLCVNSAEDNEGTQVPSLQNVTCHAIIVSNSVYDGIGIKAQQCIKDRETLRMALLKTGWKCEEICDKSAKDIKDDLRKILKRLANEKQTLVMVHFMGYTKMIMDCNYFFGKDFTVGSELLRSSVPLQWVVDLMCEKIPGPKILIVDDLNPHTTGLAEMTTPLDVMISLPKGGDPTRPQYDTSVTSNFAHLLETRRARQLSLKEILKKAAAFDRHRLSSNLLDSK